MKSRGVSRVKTNLLGLCARRFFDIKNWLAPRYTEALEEQGKGKRIRSIYLRELDGGSCGAAEIEINALFNPVYDLERLGFHLVASPRHADILLITGPLTRNMEPALLSAFYAMPEPRRVVTMGDDFEEDGIFNGSYAVVPLPPEILAVRVAHISGNPPSPEDMIRELQKIA